jgi:hypothetical protein
MKLLDNNRIQSLISNIKHSVKEEGGRKILGKYYEKPVEYFEVDTDIKIHNARRREQ